jgi:hypothetical protein
LIAARFKLTKKTGAAHFAKLLNDQRSIIGRQAEEELRSIGRAVGQMLGRQADLFFRGDAQLRIPDEVADQLRQHHAHHHDQGQPPQQRLRQDPGQ